MVKHIFILVILLGTISCKSQIKSEDKMNTENLQTATFGGGCFWCVEAIFSQLKGVYSVKPGYSGGIQENPTYKEVCTGTTGHAEVAHIKYNELEVTFEELLKVFWKTHDPTTLNKQGADIGTQYRSVIFYHTEKQKETAEKYLKLLSEEKIWKDPIVTEIVEFEKFWEAENYHNDYYANNPDQGYCKMVIQPKVEKFKKVFSDKLK